MGMELQLPEGIHVVKRIFFINGVQQHALGFDLGKPPISSRFCTERLRTQDSYCLVYFEKEPGNGWDPKKVSPATTSFAEIVRDPTPDVIIKVLEEENNYRDERTEYIVGLEGLERRMYEKEEGLVELNAKINKF